jgi:hypothetical protein
VRKSGIGWLVALVTLVCAMTVVASPAVAYEAKVPPWSICFNNEQAAETVASHMPLEPANGATVTAGTPVTFSGESTHALTFSVASSEALLSSPDIDSGSGSQSGAFNKFTSTKATATPRTIYWRASFAFTPGECESPSTFTTPVRTLVVAPSEAELATARRQQEEAAAAKKKLEEESIIPPATGSVSLDISTLDVKSTGVVARLTCTGTATCSGKLTLTAEIAGKGKRKRAKAATIGTAGFSIPAGETTAVELELSPTGRALLKTDHGRLNAVLTLLKSSPTPVQTHSENVRLVQEKVATSKKR